MTYPRMIPVVAAMVLAACGGSDGVAPPPPPPPAPVTTTIDVTAPGALLLTDTTAATAVVKDQFGAVIAGKTVTWSSNAPAATITASGVVTGAAVGSATISAAVDGKTGTKVIEVGKDDRLGYAWANDPTAATYTPSAVYSHNSAGGTVSATRSAVGTYAVTFGGLGATGAQRSGVQITAYATPAMHCKTPGWRTSGADLIVDVRCFDSAGALVDGLFTVMVAGATALEGRLGFAYADNPTTTPPASSYTPQQLRSSRGHGIRAFRSAVGDYSVEFDGLGRVGADGAENVLVTAVGEGNERCTVGSWATEFLTANVQCFNPSGAPADSKFTVLIVEKARLGKKVAFSWAHNSTGATYTPVATFTQNDGGGATTITRSSAGSYLVTFAGLVRTAGATETVLVSAYGGNGTCRIGSWGGATFAVSVFCFNPAGVAADSRFVIAVVQ